MNTKSVRSSNFLALGLPIGIMLTAVWIAKTIDFSTYPNMSLAITADLSVK